MEEDLKQLLLVDLCVRLPYQPLCKKVDTEDDFCECNGPLGYSLRDLIDNKIIIKPYLRPMSSMTDEEREEYRKFSYYGAAGMRNNDFTEMVAVPSFEKMDYLNSHHFDYRGLIEKGLAIKAPEGMYNVEE